MHTSEALVLSVLPGSTGWPSNGDRHARVSVIKVMGLKGVADTPLKRDYVHRDLERSARYMDIPFHRASNKPMSLLLRPRFRLASAKRRCDRAPFAEEVFQAQWARGQDMSEATAVAGLAQRFGVAPTTLLKAIGEEGTKTLLREAVDEAISAGVFGTPTFILAGRCSGS